MKQISVFPSRFRQLGEANDSKFYLITNSHLSDIFKIEKDEKYQDARIIIYSPGDDFLKILATEIDEPSHILVIVPDCLFESVPPDLLGPNRKLLILACNSAPTSLKSIEHFLRYGEKTNPVEQEKIAESFFMQCESTDSLKFIDTQYETIAEFNHINEEYGWHEQLGMLDWGEQQIFPSGEISCFLVPLKGINQLPNIRFDLNGEIALKGYPIVHSGSPSFLIEDRERIYQKLSTFKDYPLIATLKNGVIEDMKATHASVKPALEILESMFMLDSRFRQIFEIGFGINNQIQIISENSAMNEVYGGQHGCVHFGIGMLPYTQYHIDLICPNINVIGGNDQIIFGGN